MLVGENPYDGSFSQIGSGANNYLGLSTNQTQALHGQIDEVRVWSMARTEKQIRETMFQTLSGNEPNLVGYNMTYTSTRKKQKTLSILWNIKM